MCAPTAKLEKKPLIQLLKTLEIFSYGLLFVVSVHQKLNGIAGAVTGADVSRFASNRNTKYEIQLRDVPELIRKAITRQNPHNERTLDAYRTM